MTKNKKIKSITFKHIEIRKTPANAEIIEADNHFAIKKEGDSITSYYIGKEYINEIEYEKPKLLKRADGSLISEPPERTKVAYITTSYTDEDKDEEFVTEVGTYATVEDKILIKQGKVFLLEDTDLAEKKAAMLTKQLEIQFEIDRLNAEQGWVADWNNLDVRNNKYYLASDGSDRVIEEHKNFHSKVKTNTCQERQPKQSSKNTLKTNSNNF